MASNRSFCDVAGDLAFSHGYKLVLVAKIVICLLGILIFGTFMIFKPNRLWHHAHASLLAKYHLASAFILNLGSLGIFVFNLARLSISSSDPCSYLLSSKLQFWLSFLLLFLFFLETISILLVSIERTISTARIASYENFESRRSVIFIILFLSTLLFFALLITILLTPELAVHTGIVIVASSKSFYVLFAIIVVLGIVTVILAQITYLLNVKYRRFYRAGKSRDAEQTNRLSAVFQIEENLSMMRVLLPVSYIHLFIVSFSVADCLSMTCLATMLPILCSTRPSKRRCLSRLSIPSPFPRFSSGTIRTFFGRRL
ncbi:hypothetical protein L596_028412 [Steinernema carpocapsae]|uniref:G-protein coupled receptors family 1 profile domain-containing protein n=1 Tax=Steinernema carpocapsae TaxID=34508 RepID=A0A4V5ZXV9_STECR|nr:hypothetical protein L596_028412 [Steinernema carpocapsae]